MEEINTKLSNYVGLAVFEKDMKLIRQLEYYFGDINLPGDKFLFDTIMKRNSMAWVRIKVMQTFRKVKDFNFSDNEISWAVNRYSTTLSVNRRRLFIRRRVPLPRGLVNKNEIISRCLRVVNVPVNKSVTDLQTMFSAFGKVRCVRMETLEISEVAIVEFVDRKIAVKALKAINSSSNWRKGLHATMLEVPDTKYDTTKKSHKRKYFKKKQPRQGKDVLKPVDCNSQNSLGTNLHNHDSPKHWRCSSTQDHTLFADQ